MVRANRAKAKLLAGEIAVGGSVNFYAPILVELYGVLGFDWVWIDCEHGSSNDSESENMIRAAELHDITPVVRVPNAEPVHPTAFPGPWRAGPHRAPREQSKRS